MTKNKQETEGKNIQAVEEALSKTEHFIERNQKILLYIVLGIIVVVLGVMGFKKYYIAPLNQEAQAQMFMAETYFNMDSLDLAINGDGNYLGFIDIIDEYGLTESANLAHYYLGIAYLKKGQFEDAIDNLKDFDSDDIIVSSMAKGAIGDAYMELGETDKAISYYEEAHTDHANIFTSPMFLMKAGLAYESMQNYDKALEQYKKIKSDFPKSYEYPDIDKYIIRAETKIKKNS